MCFKHFTSQTKLMKIWKYISSGLKSFQICFTQIVIIILFLINWNIKNPLGKPLGLITKRENTNHTKNINLQGINKIKLLFKDMLSLKKTRMNISAFYYFQNGVLPELKNNL